MLMQLKAPPASEYIAVLNDTQGRPTLTAITQGDTASMRIQWQPTPLADNKNLQLGPYPNKMAKPALNSV